jgi:DNA polymerase III subunit delta
MKEKLSNGNQTSKGLFLFYGDEFLVKERVSIFVDSLMDPASKTTNLKSFDGSSLNIGDLISHLLNRPLFGGIRVALVENSTLFVSQSNASKIIEKVTEAWKRGDSKTAYRNLKQLAGLAGVNVEAGVFSDNWLKEVDAISNLDSQDQEALQQAATSFAQEFSGSISSGDENVILEFVQEGVPEDTYLIMTALSVDKRNRLFKAFDKNGHVEELKPRFDKSTVKLDKSYFQRSIREFLNSRSKTITSEALDLAFNKSGKDIRRIRSEFDKIVSYLGNRTEINITDIQELFLDFHEAAFFDLSRAVRESDSRKLLIALHENLKIVDHPLQTLAALTSEFRKIIAARELLFTDFRSSWKPDINFDQFVSLVARIRLESPPKKIQKGKFNLLAQKDFPLFQLLKTAQNFSLQRLIHIMEAILAADIRIKSTKLGSSAPNIILENLVLEICDSKQRV